MHDDAGVASLRHSIALDNALCLPAMSNRQSEQQLPMPPKSNKSSAESGQNERAELAADAPTLTSAAGDPSKNSSPANKPAGNGSPRAKSKQRNKSGKPVVQQATPSMAQYLEIKTANPDSLLWYRMGDFYELFFEDAIVAAEALSITLTKRGKHLGEDIPMCGVPVVRADEYLQRLIRQGYRVAVCEQLEDPAEARKRGAKAVVRRDVVRLVTPGTLMEDELLDARARNYLTAMFMVAASKKTDTNANHPITTATFALASLDISTGEFEVGRVTYDDLPGELMRLSPKEVLLSEAAAGDADLERLVTLAGASLTPTASAFFDSSAGARDLKEHLKVSELGGFGDYSRAELSAIGAILKYVDLTQIGRKPVIRAPRQTSSEDILVIDAASRASLELIRSTSGDKSGSLLSAIDRTVTGPGARELAARLSTPLRDPHKIKARHDSLQFFLDRSNLRELVRARLKAAPDIARAVSRLSFGRGSPRDLAAVRDGLLVASKCSEFLNEGAGAIGLPADLEDMANCLHSAPGDLQSRLSEALVDDPPPLKRDGGFVRSGFESELDEARALKDESRKVIAALEAQYVELTGIKTLKIRHNNILGYFVEVTAANAAPMMTEPSIDTFRHRQTMANAVRFTTVELSETEGKIASAGARALNLEQEIFAKLAAAVGENEAALISVSAALADLDVAASLAELAEQEAYVRPEIQQSRAFLIEGGRHPVVEQALRKSGQGPFIENDCTLGRPVAVDDAPAYAPGFDEERDARIWLVTGPNMAGKSTFLRQNALICLLAQMGSYVPANRAVIGLVDRLFSRVGASDDLARGRSTFMVEMVETAGILNLATDRSLVILDEIGRGTATFDGLSIAWATVEYLHEVCRCRALFATHYHELTVLPEQLSHVANVTVAVKEWHDEIVFLHKVKHGAADRSYGIQVAKLAGLPAHVVDRADQVLKLLEQTDQRAGSAANALDDLPLFANSRPADPVAAQPSASAADRLLSETNPDELSPREALELLYRLKDANREAGK